MELVLGAVRRIPLFDSARRGEEATLAAIYGFLALVTGAVVALTVLFGYPFFILFAVSMAVLGLVGVAVIAAADLLDKVYFAEHVRRTKGRNSL